MYLIDCRKSDKRLVKISCQYAFKVMLSIIVNSKIRRGGLDKATGKFSHTTEEKDKRPCEIVVDA